MKCLWHYEWVKLPRNIVPEGKGVLGDWFRLASRAAFRKERGGIYNEGIWLFMYPTEHHGTVGKGTLYI